MNIKQVIVMRTDLGMRKGKMIAQGAHASMKVFFDQMLDTGDSCKELGPREGWDWHGAVLPWMEGRFTKVCVQVDSEAALLAIVDQAKAARAPVALIQDSGATEFGGVPTHTCCAIGPADATLIDPITGGLKLL